MVPVTRPDGHLNLNLNYIPTPQQMSGTSTGSNSPNELPGNMGKPPFSSNNGLGSAQGSLGSTRVGAGSPSHDLGTRLYSKRAREIQAQEGVATSIWGPPTSGHSTPLRENIPESPNQDEFPNLIPSEPTLSSPARRARAGTVPSRFPPPASLTPSSQPPSFISKTSRPTPSTSPFRPPGLSGIDTSGRTATSGPGPSTAVLSRLRAGSMPQRSNNFLGSSSPFGPSVFSTNWASGRDRATTLTSIRSSEAPTSPSQSSFSGGGLADSDVKTLDYLGLAETPQHLHVSHAHSSVEALLQQQQQQSSLPPLLAELAMIKNNNNRFRSYSVNAKEKYAEDDEEYGTPYPQMPSGNLTPSAAATAAQLAATQAQIHQHNLAVQAFASHASASRPRARTAGILDAPPQRSSIRNYLATPSRLENSISAADLGIAEGSEYDELSEAVQMMHLGAPNGANMNARAPPDVTDEGNIEGPTRALWIGSIPVSTTVTSLDAIFSLYGKIESTRVLTHKNCGFVNFERLESAVQAKNLLNGKEIFPGAGPVRIGYAKVPGASSATGTPGANGTQMSPTPDPHRDRGEFGEAESSRPERIGSETPQVPPLSELKDEIGEIVKEFGASDSEVQAITASVQRSVAFQAFNDEIPAVPEPSAARMHDAPKLRDIRKRIDNGLCSVQEIEETANGMLPEIAELASDYLGNTVVQKLFEFCSEQTKEQMLLQIAPHLAEIGVHKNGTWAAQKIIDVAKAPNQMQMIVDNLRPYTVPLFLDQYGNYVLQCCLRFGSPYNDFIFETMLSRMWEVSQGRFGARAMRACLESHHATKDQQRMLAATIALHSVQLATNANGALLLTWFLDTCTFPRRRTVLAPRLVPHLVHLCTHKVAYLTILKVINQRNEPEAREIVLKALFFSPNDECLERILSDPSSGATLIFKVLTTPFFDESIRSEVVKNVSRVLTKLKATPSQGYKRLMDEVGLSSRASSRDHHAGRDGSVGHGANGEKQHRPTSRQTSSAYPTNQPTDRQFAAQYPNGANMENPTSIGRPAEQPYDYASNGMVASNGMNGLSGMSTGPNFTQDNLLSLQQQQMQYQAYLQSRNLPQTGMYPATIPGTVFPNYPASMGNMRNVSSGGAGGGSAVPGTTNQMNPNPILGQPAFAPPQFSPVLNPAQMYQQYSTQYYPQAQAIPDQGGVGRRGRH